jgi:hypothetical protein
MEMSEEVRKVYAEIDRIKAAVSTLQQRKGIALERIEQLDKQLPGLLSQFALGQCDESEVIQLHQERWLMQQIAGEPVRGPIRELETQIMQMESCPILNQYREERKARVEHKRYVEFFEKAVSSKELSAQDMVWFGNIAPVHLKAEAQELIRQFGVYYRVKADRADARFEDYVTLRPTGLE